MEATGFGKLMEVSGGLHLWPIVLAILFMGIASAVQMLTEYVFRVVVGLVDSYYEMRVRLHRSRQKFEEARRTASVSRAKTSHP